MVSVEVAMRGDIESLVDLEALLFSEDAGVFDPYADVTSPLREAAADFERLLADDNSIVLVARRNDDVVGLVAGYSAKSGPTHQAVTCVAVHVDSYFENASARRRKSSPTR